ncbi:hypothetical protein ACX80O_15980 [Arthrobacter sp. Hz1]
MTESNPPEEELNITDGIDPAEPDDLDPMTVGQPDSYPGAAEDNPDQWRDDPLLQDEPAAAIPGEDPLSDRALREELADPAAPGTPTLGEAAADIDFGDPADESEIDSSDDSANLGGSPLGQTDPDLDGR